MAKRVDTADFAAFAGIALGVIALFIPWYTYNTATQRIAVNGFRASLLGEVFFIALALLVLVLLIRYRAVDEGPLPGATEDTVYLGVAIAAAAVVLLQLFLDILAGGRSIGFGLVLAVLSAIALGAAARIRRREYTARSAGRSRIGTGLR